MFYREIAPRPILRPYINCFWMIRSPVPTTVRDRTFPDGCQEIAFNVDSNVLRSDNGQAYSANPPVELIGQMTRPYDILTQGWQTFFGVKFFPHSFSAFTRESIRNLRNQSIDLRELLRPTIHQTIDTVFERPGFERFVTLMEDFFVHSLATAGESSRCYRVVDRAVAILLSQKTHARIESLPRQLGVSERYLQQAFQQLVGLSPKQLLKMIRFQTTFRYLHDPTLSLTHIAHHCGYYDHAHFVHDFKALAGTTPSAYRTMETPLNRFFLTESSRAYLCDYKDPA